MRADMTVPELLEEYSATPNAWTSGGRIYVTTGLLLLLDRHELEAVLAHEVAHLARRDAAVIEICSAPSGVGLSYTGALRALRFPGLEFGQLLGLWVMAWLCVPPVLVLSGLSRLSMLGSSRAREYSADAAAAALTGRPSALASALLKLEAERESGAGRGPARRVDAVHRRHRPPPARRAARDASPDRPARAAPRGDRGADPLAAPAGLTSTAAGWGGGVRPRGDSWRRPHRRRSRSCSAGVIATALRSP